MRVLTGDQVLVRIFIGESDKWHHQSLYLALLERLRKEGFAGATVFHGTSGFGAECLAWGKRAADLPAVPGGSGFILCDGVLSQCGWRLDRLVR